MTITSKGSKGRERGSEMEQGEGKPQGSGFTSNTSSALEIMCSSRVTSFCSSWGSSMSCKYTDIQQSMYNIVESWVRVALRTGACYSKLVYHDYSQKLLTRGNPDTGPPISNDVLNCQFKLVNFFVHVYIQVFNNNLIF